MRQAGCTPKASVGDDRGMMDTDIATMGFTAQEASYRRWAEIVVNGPIGLRSGTDPEEARQKVETGVPGSYVSRELYTRNCRTV